ncbi:MAG: molybdopterin cofactor-binding domain-containing protein, partial [Saprospiraceae bacterium]|nr:molybdopterin cofactor-binding domain-containing protein [Saprospiraceae bacterium]
MIVEHTTAMRSQDTNLESPGHVTGQSIYVDDLPEVTGTIYALAVPSPVAHGRIVSCDVSEAINSPGVIKIFTAADVPGQNQIGGIVADETLLAENEVHYIGQPVLLIVAESNEQAHAARSRVKLDIEQLEVVTDPREAFKRGMLLHQSRRFTLGDPDDAFTRCTVIVEGQVEIGGQEHVYIEPQGAYAIPAENGRLK